MGLLNYIKETWRLNKAFYESERQEGVEDEPETITLEAPHAEEELVTYNGVTYWAPRPMTQDEYREMRRLQEEWLEYHYDLDSAAGIMAIPTKNPPRAPFGGGTAGDIDYYLHNKAYSHEKAGNIDLAILCLIKSNDIRRRGRVVYRKDDYYALVKMLARNGRVEEAYAEKAEIDNFFAVANSEDVQIKIQRVLTEAKSSHTDLVIMNPHGSTCPDCAKYQGRVFSLSGKSKLFPKIPESFYRYGGIHEGCGHMFFPYIHKVTDPLLDYTLSIQSAVKREYRKDIVAFSNRPFVDDRTPEDIAKAREVAQRASLEYERQQSYYEHMIENEIRRGEEARAFKWLQQNLPAICPKSLSGFRRMKTQNTKNYQKIVTEASKLGYEI